MRESENEEQDVGVEIGVAALGQKLKDIARTVDLAQRGNPIEAFGALETEKLETLNKRDSKIDSTVTN